VSDRVPPAFVIPLEEWKESADLLQNLFHEDNLDSYFKHIIIIGYSF